MQIKITAVTNSGEQVESSLGLAAATANHAAMLRNAVVQALVNTVNSLPPDAALKSISAQVAE